ncbi:MAG: hypothetical protein L0228_06130, partial [Planctomycetes bacterium]|nr:hypothetical protein [Planctomycetota bacterium]
MKHLADFVVAFAAVGILGALPTSAAAQGLLTYHVILEQPVPGLPLTVGVDDGSGFSFATLADDDGDGLVELPRGPVPGRLALGVTPAAGHIPGCDIWDFTSNGVSRASVPLFINALANESVGVDFGVLMSPPLALTPGQRFTITNGIFPEWPGIRLVDESSARDLEAFVREVDSLPGFNGEVIVSNTTVHFTLVPEPNGVALATSGLIALGYLRHRRNRCGRLDAAGAASASSVNAIAALSITTGFLRDQRLFYAGRRAFFALAVTAALFIPAVGSAQIARSWNTGNGVWSADSNWSPIGVPQSNDSARIGNLPAAENDVVTLDIHDTVAEVQLTDGMTLNTAGNALTVLGDTLVSGSNLVSDQRFPSRLFVDRGTLIHDYVTDNLTVADGGAVQLFDGGILRIDDLFSIDSDSGLFGEGVVQFISSGTVLANNGTIQPTVGGMTLDAFEFFGVGQLDLDGVTGNGLLDLTTSNLDGTAFPTLTIDGGTLLDPFDGEIRMATGALLAMNLDDPWSVGPNGLIRIVDGITSPARITGADVSIGGRVFITGPDGYLRIVSNATLAPSIDAELREDTRLQLTGDADVEGGMFTIAENSVIEFDGPTTIRGGTFESEITHAFDPSVVLNGNTVYRGEVTFAGHARQVGDATIAANTVIDAEIFDMDGTGGTIWTVNATATINTDRIEVGTAPNASFEGTITVGGPLTARLSVNLSDPDEFWTIWPIAINLQHWPGQVHNIMGQGARHERRRLFD